MKNKSAFTLIELMVVLGLIVVLTLAGVVSYSVLRPKTRDQRRKTDMELIRAALEMYKADNNGYYSDNMYDGSLISYLAGGVVPTDPKDGSNYDYQASGPLGFSTSYCLQTCLEVDAGNTNPVCTASACVVGDPYLLSSP